MTPAPDRAAIEREVGLSKAAIDVLAERRRQVEAEGWTPKHDDAHDKGELASAAVCYAAAASCPHRLSHGFVEYNWPWNFSWWKPKDRRRDLVRAGALIFAEIERLDRLATLTERDGEKT